jgi:hypothetical protein
VATTDGGSGRARRHRWWSRRHLLAHFRKHGPKLGVGDAADYDRSARDTIRHDTRFTYTYSHPYTPGVEEPRVGYYDRQRQQFTAVSDHDAVILSHFEAPERYVRELKDSTHV